MAAPRRAPRWGLQPAARPVFPGRCAQGCWRPLPGFPNFHPPCCTLPACLPASLQPSIRVQGFLPGSYVLEAWAQNDKLGLQGPTSQYKGGRPFDVSCWEASGVACRSAAECCPTASGRALYCAKPSATAEQGSCSTVSCPLVHAVALRSKMSRCPPLTMSSSAPAPTCAALQCVEDFGYGCSLAEARSCCTTGSCKDLGGGLTACVPAAVPAWAQLLPMDAPARRWASLVGSGEERGRHACTACLWLVQRHAAAGLQHPRVLCQGCCSHHGMPLPPLRFLALPFRAPYEHNKGLVAEANAEGTRMDVVQYGDRYALCSVAVHAPLPLPLPPC